MDNNFNYEYTDPEVVSENLGITPEDITKKAKNGEAIRREYETVPWKDDEEIYDPAELVSFKISDGDIFMQVGESRKLEVSFSPWISNDPNLVWESSDYTLARVTQEGTVSALGIGEVMISAQIPQTELKDHIWVYITEDGKIGPDKPEEKENTPAQEEIKESVIEQIESGTTNITVEGVIGNLEIPVDTPKAITINGTFEDVATITNLSGKSITINNTSGQPVNIVIDSPSASTTLKGTYGDVWANTKSIYGTNAKIQSVTFDTALEGKGSLSVNADWVDPVEVISYNTNDLTISNASDETVLEALTVTAPRSTVTVNGKWGEVTVTSGKDTTILNSSFHANKLKVLSGNVKVKNCFPEQAYDELEVADGYTLEAWSGTCPGVSNTTSNAGVYTVISDCRYTNGIVYGAVASGNYKYTNNAKFTSGNKNAVCLVRSAVHAYFYGPGIWENPAGYGMWLASDKGSIDIYDGQFIAVTHAVYCEKGIINIYGGQFSITNEDKTYLLNCKDDAYTAGTAKINVYGGKFYGFDPANSMSEPGGPVSFVPEGYQSVEVEPGVWEVKAVN